MPFRVFCEPSRTARYVASSLFFFFDFLPLGFLMGIACRLLDDAPSSVSSPGSVSRSKGSSFASLEVPGVSTAVEIPGSCWGISLGSNGSAIWDSTSLLLGWFSVWFPSVLAEVGSFPAGSLVFCGSSSFGIMIGAAFVISWLDLFVLDGWFCMSPVAFFSWFLEFVFPFLTFFHPSPSSGVVAIHNPAFGNGASLQLLV